METIILYIGIAVVVVFIFFLIVRVSSNAIAKEIKRNPDLFIGDEDDKQGGDYQSIFKKDWGFKVVEGDLDGAPDVDFSFIFKKELTEEEKKGIASIFSKWYKKGFGKDEEEGEFGGHFHFMHDPQFEGRYAQFGFDLGSVYNLDQALESLLKDLKEWNKGNIEKFVFGQDDEIFEQING